MMAVAKESKPWSWGGSRDWAEAKPEENRTRRTERKRLNLILDCDIIPFYLIFLWRQILSSSIFDVAP
jgi:hypothetical protein